MAMVSFLVIAAAMATATALEGPYYPVLKEFFKDSMLGSEDINSLSHNLKKNAVPIKVVEWYLQAAKGQDFDVVLKDLTTLSDQMSYAEPQLMQLIDKVPEPKDHEQESTLNKVRMAWDLKRGDAKKQANKEVRDLTKKVNAEKKVTAALKEAVSVEVTADAKTDETDWDEEESEIVESATEKAYKQQQAKKENLKHALIQQEKPKVELKVEKKQAVAHGTGALPSGWSEHKRVENDRKFYYHKESNTVVWDDKLSKNSDLKTHLKITKKAETEKKEAMKKAVSLAQVRQEPEPKAEEKAAQPQAQEQVAAKPQSSSSTKQSTENSGVWDIMFWVLLVAVIFMAGWWCIRMRMHERIMAWIAASVFGFKKWFSSLFKGRNTARAGQGGDDGSSSTSESSLGSSDRSGTTSSSGMGGLNGHLQGVIDRVKKNFEDTSSVEAGSYEKQVDEEQPSASTDDAKGKGKGYVRQARK